MSDVDDELLVQDALAFVPADDREVWVRMGIAIKGRFGDAGKWLWMEWSETAANFKKLSAESVWRSIRAAGGLGLLIAEARKCGWSGKVGAGMTPEEMAAKREESDRRAAASEAERAAGYARVKEDSQKFYEQCIQRRHPYLARKGFPTMRAPTRGDLLIVPMTDFKTGELWNIQKIDPDGGKFYQRSGRAKGLALPLRFGAGPRVYVEGFATGLSVRAAMKTLEIEGRVIVTFSADNLKHIASLDDECAHGRFVVADNDAPNPKTGKRPGLEAAKATGLPFWLPPKEDTDANDFHQSAGIDALRDAMERLFAS